MRGREQKAKLGKGTLLAPGTKLSAGADIGDNSKVGDGSVIGSGAVIGSDVTIGKSVTLQSVKRMGGGTVIGAGSSIGEPGPALAMLDGNETQGNATETSGVEGEAGAEEEEYYRPDPGSPYSRKGNAEINMELDGHNHWPVFLGCVPSFCSALESLHSVLVCASDFSCSQPQYFCVSAPSACVCMCISNTFILVLDRLYHFAHVPCQKKNLSSAGMKMTIPQGRIPQRRPLLRRRLPPLPRQPQARECWRCWRARQSP